LTKLIIKKFKITRKLPTFRELLSFKTQPMTPLWLFQSCPAVTKMFISAVVFMLPFVANSQKIIEGQVLSDHNEPVPFAFLSVRKISAGTAANASGNFKLDLSGLSENDSLVVSHINYTTARISTGDLIRSQGKITLHESVIELKEIEVKGKEDDDILKEIIARTKQDLKMPFRQQVYYREWVKENASYNRFADGTLTMMCPGDRDELAFRVDQSRAFHLPKDEDEMFELVSPLKMESILRNAYADFLNRFVGERKDDYHFYATSGNTFDDFYIVQVEPKKTVPIDDDKIYMKALIKADKNKDLREVTLAVDSLTHYSKSALGLKMSVVDGHLTFIFNRTKERNFLAYARVEYKLRFTFRKTDQTDVFTSEFLVTDLSDESIDIPRKDRYSKNSLYKNGTRYDTEFWKDIQVPSPTTEEQKLIEDIEKKHTVATK